MSEKPEFLTIFDLDETLVHAFGTFDDGDFDFRVAGYDVRVRPHAATVIRAAASLGGVAVWTAATEDYAEAMLAQMWPKEVPLVFCFTRKNCTNRSQPTMLFTSQNEPSRIKDLSKIKRYGFQLERTVFVEDRPDVVPRHRGNVIPVSSFEGDRRDRELIALASYLPKIEAHENVRTVDKRHWRAVVPDWPARELGQ